MTIKYKRVLLKLSGEALQGTDGSTINANVLQNYAAQIKNVYEHGVQVGIVVGGGNIFRGGRCDGLINDRVQADQMGMLATIVNSLAVQDALRSMNMMVQTYTSVNVEGVGERFSKSKALEAMEQGNVVIVGGGTGNPFFSTDTAAALRALELQADALLKGTHVDGVYNRDPFKHKDAVKYNILSYNEAIEKRLEVMDTAAFALCSENNLPIVVFNINHTDALLAAACGEIGTTIN